MFRSILILLFIPHLAHAIQLTGKLPGKWHGVKNRSKGITIRPEKIHFRFCRPSKITHQGEPTEDETEHLGLHIRVHPISIYSHGPNKEPAHCLPRGHHDCLFTVASWESQPQELFLDIACDQGTFQKSYFRRLYHK